jgi:hypothetical protein
MILGENPMGAKSEGTRPSSPEPLSRHTRRSSNYIGSGKSPTLRVSESKRREKKEVPMVDSQR